MKHLSARNAMIYHCRICFLNGGMSPEILHLATGVEVDVCAEFMAHVLTTFMFDDAPCIEEELTEQKKEE